MVFKLVANRWRSQPIASVKCMDQSETQAEIAHASSTIGLSFKNTKIELVQNDQEKDQMSRVSSRNRSFWSLVDNFKAQLKVSPSQIRNNGSDGFN